MRELVAYILSAMIHGSVIGTLILWPALGFDYSLAVRNGQSISTITLTAAMAAEQSDPAEMEMEIIAEMAATPVEISPSPFKTDAHSPAEVEVAQVSQVAVVQPVKRQPTEEQPRDNTPPKLQKTKRTASVASAAMDFQAANELGVVDELPRKHSTNAPPHYPVDALLAKVEGRVVLLVRVLSNGTVSSAKIEHTSDHDSLDQAALAAVLRWRFEPARRGGLPVDYEVLVPVSFSIRKS